MWAPMEHKITFSPIMCSIKGYILGWLISGMKQSPLFIKFHTSRLTFSSSRLFAPNPSSPRDLEPTLYFSSPANCSLSLLSIRSTSSLEKASLIMQTPYLFRCSFASSKSSVRGGYSSGFNSVSIIFN